MKLRKLALALVVVLLAPAAALAVPFKYDTQYKLSGTFNWGHFGQLTLKAGSTLFYDSGADLLTIDAAATASATGNTEYDLNFLLGEANPIGTNEVAGVVDIKAGDKLQFDFAPGQAVKNGMTQIGNFVVPNGARARRRVFQPGDFMVFSKATKPFIELRGGSLAFRAWTGVWGNGWDVHADPFIRLTEMPTPPGNEIPEPFTFGLLASGLLGGAAARRRRQE